MLGFTQRLPLVSGVCGVVQFNSIAVARFARSVRMDAYFADARSVKAAGTSTTTAHANHARSVQVNHASAHALIPRIVEFSSQNTRECML